MPLVLNTASNAIIQVVSVLPAAGPQYSGIMFILKAAGQPNRLYICTQNSLGNFEWVNVATTD